MGMYRTGQGWRGESKQVKIRTIQINVALGILCVVPLVLLPGLAVTLEGTFFIHNLLTVGLLVPSLFFVFSCCFLHADQHQPHKKLVRCFLSFRGSRYVLFPCPHTHPHRKTAYGMACMVSLLALLSFTRWPSSLVPLL